MHYDSHSAELRRERLREEGKIELPLNVDTSKYLLSAIKFRDLLISSPLLLAGLITLYVLHKTIGINSQIIIISLAPWITFLLILSIQHPDRKNISFFKHRIVWRLQYNHRQKLFVYSKGDLMNKDKKLKDIREQLGITNIYSDCYETLDKRLVKVIRVSSINLSLLNNQDKKVIFQSYETFLNDLPRNLGLQISQIAQPINLSNYFRYVQTRTANETNQAKKIMAKGYLNFVDDIQKSNNMVSRNRYVIVSKPFNSQNKERVLDDLERETKILISLIENMLSGRFQLKTKVLNNQELFNLIYTCIDYENAQINTGFKTTVSSPITIGINTYKKMSEEWEKSRANRIL